MGARWAALRSALGDAISGRVPLRVVLGYGLAGRPIPQRLSSPILAPFLQSTDAGFSDGMARVSLLQLHLPRPHAAKKSR